MPLYGELTFVSKGLETEKRRLGFGRK